MFFIQKIFKPGNCANWVPKQSFMLLKADFNHFRPNSDYWANFKPILIFMGFSSLLIGWNSNQSEFEIWIVGPIQFWTLIILSSIRGNISQYSRIYWPLKYANLSNFVIFGQPFQIEMATHTCVFTRFFLFWSYFVARTF